jgi:hypothetical protein
MKVTLFEQVPYCYMQADQPERTWAATGSFLAAA